MTLDQIKEALKDRNLSYVAKEIKMSRQQLWAIASGRNPNPTIKTMQRISEYLNKGHE